jgi:predicted KAP-like P-loop ATPase
LTLRTEFETLQLEGEIAEDVIKNIENSKNYLDDYIQTIIEDNTGKKAKYGRLTPHSVWRVFGLVCFV